MLPKGIGILNKRLNSSAGAQKTNKPEAKLEWARGGCSGAISDPGIVLYSYKCRIVGLMVGIMSVLGTGYAQELSENPYGVESTSNPYGQYGSPFGIESVNNPFGRGIPLETKDVDSGLEKGEDQTEALDDALTRQRQELETERIELTAEAERLAKEFEAKIQAEMIK